jgi:SEC-C motif-containing protein
MRCCAALHQGTPATDALALMRSRYSAYVLSLEQYLLDTWHSSTRPASLNLAADQCRMRWIGLDVKLHEQIDDMHARVEFIARYKIGGRAHRLHEVSRFVCENERWFYVRAENVDISR